MLNRLFIATLLIYLAACSDPRSTGREYMPDMVHSQAYEAYTPNPNLPDSTMAGVPVKGTIPRGYTPYHYPNTPEGYEQAGREVKLANFIEINEQNLAEGKRLFNIYCAICHGESGEGNGHIVETEKFPAVPPSYFREDILILPEGKMIHTTQYGKGQMGSYASQLTLEERSMIVAYIKEMQSAMNNEQ